MAKPAKYPAKLRKTLARMAEDRANRAHVAARHTPTSANPGRPASASLCGGLGVGFVLAGLLARRRHD